MHPNYRKETEFVSYGDFPYISYLMKYSGFLPLSFDNKNETLPISKICMSVSFLLLSTTCVCLIGNIYEIVAAKYTIDGSLLLFQCIYLLILFQGISYNVLMLLKIKTMIKIIKIIKNISIKYWLRINTRFYFIVAASCLIILLLFAVLTEVTHCSLISENYVNSSNCYSQVYAFFPENFSSDATLGGIILIIKYLTTFHALLLSVITDIWIMNVTEALIKGIKKSKSELVLLSNKGYSFTKEFAFWNKFYSRLHLWIRHTAENFSFLLLLNVFFNSSLLCLSLYWAVIQLRDFDWILLLFPSLLVISQFIRMTFLAARGNQFKHQVFEWFGIFL